MKLFCLIAGTVFLLGANFLPNPAAANSAFDVFGKVFKKPSSQPVNIRKWGAPTSQVLFQVYHGRILRVTGGSCTNAKTGAEIDITIYKTRTSLYRALSKPNVFCQVYFDDTGDAGWMRGTHFMPDSAFD